jgi:eukaryotic-like serine/threonine-protein kinase
VNPDRWRRIEELFQSALERAPEERAAFLQSACADDEGMRREVESLLAANEKAGGILDTHRTPSGDPTNIIGTIVNGRYRVESLLGEGGMGVVYRAIDLRAGAVALKVLRGDFYADVYAARRFRREAEAVARVRHPNVVAVFELGLAPGVGMFIAMECLEGHTLRTEMFERRKLPVHDAIAYGSQICAGVGAAHLADIVHRDIKPENVFLVDAAARARVKMLDFGVAKLAGAAGEVSRSLTSTGAFLGTPAYAAPEQWGGGEVDARSDVYAIGCLLFEMLVGRPPFVSHHPAELMRQHLARAPETPSHLAPHVPEALDATILKALSKDPAGRFPSAAALGRALSV